MVGPCGLEPQSSTVSKRRDYVLPITYKVLKAALVRVNTAKTEFLQVKLQVRNSCRMPWVYIMIVAEHLRPAAIKAGVILKPGQRFGFHDLRHSRSSLLITGQKSDVRTTQDILRHSNSATTIELYTQSPMAQRIAAQESVLSAILRRPTARTRIRTVRNGLKTGWEKAG